jgi:hypothetical protein
MSVPVVLVGCAFVGWGYYTIASIFRPETQWLTVRGQSISNLIYMVVNIILLTWGGFFQ